MPFRGTTLTSLKQQISVFSWQKLVIEQMRLLSYPVFQYLSLRLYAMQMIYILNSFCVKRVFFASTLALSLFFQNPVSCSISSFRVYWVSMLIRDAFRKYAKTRSEN